MKGLAITLFAAILMAAPMSAQTADGGISADMLKKIESAQSAGTADKDVYKVVADVALDKDFPSYALELPKKGKDIVVNLYSDNGEEGYDITEKLLKWNGDSFTQVAE